MQKIKTAFVLNSFKPMHASLILTFSEMDLINVSLHANNLASVDILPVWSCPLPSEFKQECTRIKPGNVKIWNNIFFAKLIFLDEYPSLDINN